MEDSIIKTIQDVRFLTLHNGTPPNPAVLQVTMDTVAATPVQISLTVAAARQLQAGLAKMLLSLDSRSQ